MSEQINPGDGWRLLGPDEVVKDGDEPWHRFEKRWMYGPMEVPYTAKAYPAVRRRIPAKPEPLEINDSNGELSTSAGVSDCSLIRDGRGKFPEVIVLSGIQEIRQLSDWLTRYAAWREAQDAAK